MPSNNWTKQTPKTGASTRAVLAERVYIAPADTAYADPGAKLNGSAPGGSWVDLGIVAGSQVQLNYNKEIRAVNTGFEQVRRGSYTMAKSCVASFTLEQMDIDILALLTDLSIDTVGAIGGKLHLGQDDLVEKAILFVGTNKVDGKEFQHYCKKASISFTTDQQDDARVLRVTADLYSFVPSGESDEAFVTMYVLD